jgi:hypothetical protein
MTPEWATGISLLALVISIGSALATWWAPQIAARVAEGLRSAAARTDLKRQVFLTLMQQRAVPFTEEAVQAFNIIDVVFVDAPSVREKWAVYYNSGWKPASATCHGASAANRFARCNGC